MKNKTIVLDESKVGTMGKTYEANLEKYFEYKEQLQHLDPTDLEARNFYQGKLDSLIKTQRVLDGFINNNMGAEK